MVWILLCSASSAFAASCKLVLIAEWPVRLVGGLPIVEGAVNGQKVGILIDTGAFRSMILKSAATRLGLQAQQTGNRVYGVGGESAVALVEIAEFRVGKTTRKNWQVLSVGERDFGTHVSFILGTDLFEQVDLELDYAGGFVRLFEPQDCGAASLAYWSKDGAGVIEIDRDENIRFEVQVNGKPVQAKLDTGSTNSVLHLSVASWLGVSPGGPGVVEAGCALGVGERKIEEWIGPFESFTIGDETIRNPRLAISDLWKYTTYTDISSRIPRGFAGRPSMLIGTDFLRTHRVYVARSQRKLYFTYIGGLVFPSIPAGACARPRPEANLQASDGGEKLASLDRALVGDANNASLLLQRGIELLEHKQYDRAIADFDSAIQSGARHAALYHNRGTAWHKKGDYQRAIKDFDEAIRLDPRLAASFRARGITRAQQGDDEAAVADYDKAMALEPRLHSLVGSRGHAYYRLGRYEAAARDLAAYASSDPKELQKVVWKYLAQARSGRDARDELRSDAAASESKDWPEPLVRFHLGHLDQAGLLAAAEHADETKRNEQKCEANFHIAQRWLILNKLSEARPLLKRAYDECPRNFVEYLAAAAELKRMP